MNPLATFADGPLAHDLVNRVVAAAATVLEQRGLDVARDDVRAALAGFADATVTGTRVTFPASVVHDFLADYRARHPFTPRTDLSVSAISHSHHIVDLDDKLRPLMLADLRQTARLLGALADTPVSGIAPGIPQDVPPPLQGLAQLIATAQNKPGFAAYASHYPQAQPFIRECYEVLGQSHGAGIHMVSPLRFEGQEVDEALDFRAAYPAGHIGIGTMPIIGATTPATALSAFTIALAEIVGCALILIATGTSPSQLSLSINAYPFDMRHGAFVFGTPANLVCTMLERELNRYLGTEIPAKSFSVMAQHPGPQANALKGLSTGFMMAQGRCSFSGAGGLSLDEVFSPVQLIYDREIILYLQRAREMLAASLGDDLLLLDEILGATSDSFLDSDSTFEHFRTLQWDSSVFPTRMLLQWQQAGSPFEADAAKAEVTRLLSTYDYELPAAQCRALEAIYQAAAQNLL